MRLNLITTLASIALVMGAVGCSRNQGLSANDQARIDQANAKAKQADARTVALDQQATELQTTESKKGKELEAREQALAKSKEDAATDASKTKEQIAQEKAAVIAEREASLKMLSSNQSLMTDFLKAVNQGQQYPVMVVLYGTDTIQNWEKARLELSKLDEAQAKYVPVKREEYVSGSEFRTFRSMVFLGSAEKYAKYIEMVKKDTLLFAYSYPVTKVTVRTYLNVQTNDGLENKMQISESGPIDVGLAYPQLNLADPTSYAGLPESCKSSMTIKCLTDLKTAGDLFGWITPAHGKVGSVASSALDFVRNHSNGVLTAAPSDKAVLLVDFLRDQAQNTVSAYEDISKNSYVKGATSITDIVLSYKIFVIGTNAEDGAERSAGLTKMDGIEFSNGRELVLTPIETAPVGIDLTIKKDNLEMGHFMKDLAKSI